MVVANPKENWIELGQVVGAFGIKGFVKIKSYTDPASAILKYQPLHLKIDGRWQQQEIDSGQMHGSGIIIRFKPCSERDAALKLKGARVGISRDLLPHQTDANSYYWADLVGLEVKTEQSDSLGKVDSLLETGSNDILVVVGEQKHLIPFLLDDVVKKIDLANNTMVVNWDPTWV